MNKTEIVILDSMGDFVKGFSAYADANNRHNISMAGFWEKDRCLEYLESHKADVLLISEEFSNDFKQQINCKTQITLDEEIGKGGIYKYQPADEIIREIFAIYEIQVQKISSGRKSRLIAVYSPCKSYYQTPFALTAAASLSANNQVLYLNFCENAGFETIFQRNYERDLSDLIYMSEHHEDNLSALIPAVSYAAEGFTYVPPTRNSADVFSLSKSEWLRFIKGIKFTSGFEVVVLDIESMIPGFYEILNECEEIYAPYTLNYYNKARISHFENVINCGEYGDLAERIRQVNIPTLEGVFQSTDMLSAWQWGEIGEYVRDILRRERSYER